MEVARGDRIFWRRTRASPGDSLRRRPVTGSVRCSNPWRACS